MRAGAALSFSAAVLVMTVAVGGSAAAAVPRQPRLQSAYSASALYDLGNFYARDGHPALAALNYERALVFAPSDADIRANLSHVRESVGLPSPPTGWLSHYDRLANPNVMYWIGLSGLILAGVSLLLRRSHSKHRVVLSAAAVLGALSTALTFGDAIATASMLHEAVAMQAALARASPISRAEPLFTVSLADTVRVREQHGGFVLVRDSQGREGWVDGSDLQRVIPAH